MKIGIQLLAYECENTLEEVLTPWLILKDSYEVYIWVASGQFKIYKDLGYKNNNQATLNKIEELLNKGVINYLFTPDEDNLLSDHETRNKCISYFKENDVDLMIQLDSDEFYTKKDVKNYIKFVEENKNFTLYKTTFKNLISNGDEYMDWVRFSSGWIKRHGGISRYYFDAHWFFNGENNKEMDYRSHSSVIIPKELVYPEHDTWTYQKKGSELSDIKSKIEYQKKYYSHDCGWSWDEKNNKVVPNKSFWGDNLPKIKSKSNKQFVILSPSTSGKSTFIEKNKLFNNISLYCNELLSSVNNIDNNFHMGSTASMVPTGHELYKPWDEIYKIGLNIFYENPKYSNSCLLYNSTKHVSYLVENYPNLELKIVLLNEDIHYKNFIKKWSDKNETEKKLIDLIKENSEILPSLFLSSWWYILEERKIYTELSKKYNIKIYNSFEESLK